MRCAVRKSAQPKEPKSWTAPGRIYRVRNYHTGDFIGEVRWCDNQVACLEILDPLRPFAKGSCPFPQCLLAEDHDGEHKVPTLSAGRLIEVPWRLAEFEPQRLAELLDFKSRGAA